MSHTFNGKENLADDIEYLDFEEEAQDLGIVLSPEVDEIIDIGEIDAKNWKQFQDIFTDSLWIFGARSREGVHSGKYHGNFVPQIPYQAIRRFTKPGDVILDTFLGSGTTLIEARRLGRHGIGVELIDTVAADAEQIIETADNPHNSWQVVVHGDSTSEETINQIRSVLQGRGRNQIQLLIMHPPYHDIIKFSDDSRDLCNTQTVADFIENFTKVVHRTYDLLEQNHFLVVVIGDKYSDSEWIPLGFHTMNAIQAMGYTLKSIVVKNMEGNRAKRNLQNFWRQRAFRGNYYIFKHEYVFFFQKTGKVVERLKKVKEYVEALDDREELNLIEKNSFASGEALSRLISKYARISPSRILALKQGQIIKAIVVDFTDIKITEDVKDELRYLLSNKADSVVDVSILAEADKKVMLQEIPGVSQVYSPDDYSLELLAHTLYSIKKATRFGQRAGSKTR